MLKYLLISIAAGVIIGDGYLTGVWSGRWQQEDPAADAAKRIQDVPMTIGDWKGEDQTINQDPTITARIIQRAGFSGYVSRTYTKGEQRVNILLACGRPGPLSVHTPEVCYGGAGFGLFGDPAKCNPAETASAAQPEFWKATFIRRTGSEGRQLRVVWGWNKKSVWLAPGSPRWAFAGTPVLYKLYITQEYYADDPKGGEGTMAFLKDFMPEFDKVTAAGP
jgi:hypothetical protein